MPVSHPVLQKPCESRSGSHLSRQVPRERKGPARFWSRFLFPGHKVRKEKGELDLYSWYFKHIGPSSEHPYPRYESKVKLCSEGMSVGCRACTNVLNVHVNGGAFLSAQPPGTHPEALLVDDPQGPP